MDSAPQKTPTQAQGVSLGQDAWRRLRRNRLTMFCLVTLITIALLAFLTPSLPLLPPDDSNTQLQYQPPYTWPLFERSFRFDWQLVEQTPPAVARVRGELAVARGELRTSEQRLDAIFASTATGSPPSAAAIETAESDVARAMTEIRRKTAEIEDIIQRPYREAGFADLNTLARWMVRLRYHLFGQWSASAWFGRDELGRDVLSRVFWGARISIIVGIVATLVSLVIGVTYGALAGYVGGWIDDLMMRIVDVLYSIPFIFVVIFIVTILDDPSLKAQLTAWGIDRITIFYFVVGAIYWLTMARVVRGQVLSLRTEPFVEAARALGASQSRIIVGHILPNLLSVVIVYLTLTIPRVMLFEAFLSFLGLGVQPPDVSWGLLANEGIKVITPIRIYWWLILFPSSALGLTLFALNFLGDGLRDALDPKLASR